MTLTKQGNGTWYGPIRMLTHEELAHLRAQPKKGQGRLLPKAHAGTLAQLSPA